MRRRLLAVMAVLMALAAQGLAAADLKPVLLGEKEVSFRVERDDLVVGLKEGLFSRLMFEVEKNDLEMIKVQVTYGNGKSDVIPLRHFFKEDSRSRIIDLPGAKRIIRRITFFYKTTGQLVDGRAVIKVYGL